MCMGTAIDIKVSSCLIKAGVKPVDRLQPIAKECTRLTGDGKRGRTNAGEQRCEAPAMAGKGDELKGRKRLRGRKGRTVQGKRQKGGVSPSGAEGSTGTGGGRGWFELSKKLNRKKGEIVGSLSGDHMAMRGSQKKKEKKKEKTANRDVWAGDVETEWAEPFLAAAASRCCPLQYEKFNHISQFRPIRSSSQMRIPHPTIKFPP